jgi:hypothetical protein
MESDFMGCSYCKGKKCKKLCKDKKKKKKGKKKGK